MKRLTAILLVLVLVCLPLVSQPAEAVESKAGYMSLQEAGTALRDYMVQRRTDEMILNIHIPMSRGLTDWQVLELLDAQAQTHDGVGKHGDTLVWARNQIGYIMEEEFDGKDHYIRFRIYTATYYSTTAQEKALDTKVAQILGSLSLNGKSDYEKIKAIYDYVCQNVRYSEYLFDPDYNPESPEGRVIYSTYGALVNNSAVCQGFAGAMYRLLLEAGIDNRIVAGDGHGWNIVKLDGKYYCLDATWDSDNAALGNEYRYFLKGATDFWDNGHTTWLDKAKKEFRDKYPISQRNYGAEATATASGQCGDNATYTLAEDGTLTIQGTGAIWDTTRYLSEWGIPKAYVKKIVIQPGITAIGTDAFYNCQALTSVSIPDTVTEIGAGAFGLCTSLRSISVPNSVTQIGAEAFNRCWSLTDITLPSGLTQISDGMFQHCAELKNFVIPNGVKTVGEYAFSGCPSLVSITIPNSVTTLGYACFASSFDPAAKPSLTLPGSVVQAGDACLEATGLREILWNAGTEKVPDYALNMCESLERAVFSNAVKEFGFGVFHDCSGLKDVTLPKNLQKMGGETFYNCLSLERVDLPDTLQTLSQNTFLRCAALKEVALPNGITAIEHHAFEGCLALESLTVPASVKLVEMYAFANSGIKEIRFAGDAPEIVGETFAAMVPEVCLIRYPEGNRTWTADVKQAFKDSGWNVRFADETPAPTDPQPTEPVATTQPTQPSVPTTTTQPTQPSVPATQPSVPAPTEPVPTTPPAVTDPTTPAPTEPVPTTPPATTVPVTGPTAAAPTTNPTEPTHTTQPVQPTVGTTEPGTAPGSGEDGFPTVTVVIVCTVLAMGGIGGYFGYRQVKKKQE